MIAVTVGHQGGFNRLPRIDVKIARRAVQAFGTQFDQVAHAHVDVVRELLVDFLVTGSEAQTPYGLNGFGSGRMPGFGAILDQEDIDLLARYLRSGDLTGMGGE